jgi:mannonate dehydratase
MKQTWRWFGPQDPVSLDYVKQAGASGVVSALHHLYRGEKWPLEEVLKRKDQIESAGLTWTVVESIPVHNSIKLRSQDRGNFIAAWKDSLRAVAKAGVKTICYNFMPIVDWTRTDLRWKLPTTGYALRFDPVDFAAYDLFMLERQGAEGNYSEAQLSAARSRFARMSEERKSDLERTIIAGLPGGEASYTRDEIRSLIEEYRGMSAQDLRANLIEFLREVAPVAEDCGVRLAIHPDDPPLDLFGIPRVVSTASDVRAIFAGHDHPANGLTFCVGSFGAREDNQLSAMVEESAPRIHFAHLRQVTREVDGAFHEAEHLDRGSDMVGLVRALLTEETRRWREDGTDCEIPMRPDHGHLLGDDYTRTSNPGYSFVGRLKGLAELRGVMQGLKAALPELSA